MPVFRTPKSPCPPLVVLLSSPKRKSNTLLIGLPIGDTFAAPTKKPKTSPAFLSVFFFDSSSNAPCAAYHALLLDSYNLSRLSIKEPITDSPFLPHVAKSSRAKSPVIPKSNTRTGAKLDKITAAIPAIPATTLGFSLPKSINRFSISVNAGVVTASMSKPNERPF